MKRNLLILFAFVLSISCLLGGTYSGGNGSLGDPYKISTLNDILELTQTSGDWTVIKHFIQTNDIDASATSTWNSGKGLSPIGSTSQRFRGTYNGQGHKITNIYISRSSSDYIGLFSYITDAKITMLHLNNVNITGNSSVGAMCGRIYDNSTISNCSVSGSISGYYNVGGFVGYNDFESHIDSCVNTATITGDAYVGGIAGHNTATSTIYHCFSSGTINSPNYSTGGICGRMLSNSTIINCYSVSTINGDRNTGGLCGSTGSGSHVTNCYVAASVSGSTLTGAFIGYQDAATELLNCFYDSDISSLDAIGSGARTGILGKTTLEMKTQSTFTNAGWDFTNESANGNDDIWNIDGSTNNGYPFFTVNYESASPITLAAFTAKAKAGVVELAWETASETNNASFLIYRNGKALAKIDGAGTTTETNNYVYTDATVVPGVAYTYVLADIDYANNETKYEADAVTITLANDVVEADFVIGAAYPNPFNPTAVIPVNLTREAVVNAKIYTLTGREVATIANGRMNAGSHNLRISAKNMTTGLYLVKVMVENVIDVQKIAFVK